MAWPAAGTAPAKSRPQRHFGFFYAPLGRGCTRPPDKQTNNLSYIQPRCVGLVLGARVGAATAAAVPITVKSDVEAACPEPIEWVSPTSAAFTQGRQHSLTR